MPGCFSTRQISSALVIVPRANAIGWRKGPLDMAGWPCFSPGALFVMSQMVWHFEYIALSLLCWEGVGKWVGGRGDGYRTHYTTITYNKADFTLFWRCSRMGCTLFVRIISIQYFIERGSHSSQEIGEREIKGESCRRKVESRARSRWKAVYSHPSLTLPW
jgi:hypothetical protein